MTSLRRLLAAGARYLFASAQNKAAFLAAPDPYLPQFSGL